MSSEQASDEDHATVEYALNYSQMNIGQPGEMEKLHDAKGILEGWINSDDKNPNKGSFKIYLQKVNDLINESNKKKNEQMKAGRRHRKNRKSRKSKKSRKVRKTRKN